MQHQAGSGGHREGLLQVERQEKQEIQLHRMSFLPLPEQGIRDFRDQCYY